MHYSRKRQTLLRESFLYLRAWPSKSSGQILEKLCQNRKSVEAHTSVTTSGNSARFEHRNTLASSREILILIEFSCVRSDWISFRFRDNESEERSYKRSWYIFWFILRFLHISRFSTRCVIQEIPDISSSRFLALRIVELARKQNTIRCILR